jgi:hypothetical protein
MRRRTPSTGTNVGVATAGERVEGWALAGAAGADRADVDGEMTEVVLGTAMVADCETTAKAEDADSRRVDVELSAGRKEGKDWTESEVGMDSVVEAEGMSAPVSGPSFLADFGKIRLSQFGLPFLEGKLIVVGGKAGGISQGASEVVRFTFSRPIDIAHSATN